MSMRTEIEGIQDVIFVSAFHVVIWLGEIYFLIRNERNRDINEFIKPNLLSLNLGVLCSNPAILFTFAKLSKGVLRKFEAVGVV